jgi:hypothetical protein
MGCYQAVRHFTQSIAFKLFEFTDPMYDLKILLRRNLLKSRATADRDDEGVEDFRNIGF